MKNCSVAEQIFFFADSLKYMRVNYVYTIPEDSVWAATVPHRICARVAFGFFDQPRLKFHYIFVCKN